MTILIQFLLPLYLFIYFLLLIVVRTAGVRRKTGKNPIVLSTADDAHGLISSYFLIWMLALAVYTLVFSVFHAAYPYFLPLNYLESSALKVAGLTLLIISLLFTYKAQGDMHESWRIGIDQSQVTDLVTNGVFLYSRNPIYVGMLSSVLGLVFITPNAFTVMLLVVGYILIQIQVRLEEEHLQRTHGKMYSDYKDRVARFF